MNTAQALTNAARDLLLAHPQLDPSRAFALALERDPQLARDHHAGIAGEAVLPVSATPSTSLSPELVDPGVLIAEHAAAGGLTFAEACKVLPNLAAAYHRAEMIERPKPGPGPAGSTILHFRAPLPREIGADGALRGVEVMRVGVWNNQTFTTADLDAIVAAAPVVGFVPPIKLGHDNDPAALAHGVVTNLRRVGDVLLCDFEGMPAETVALIKGGRLLSLSAEIFTNLKRGGRIFAKALAGVALLGGHVPAVSGLRPLAGFLPAGSA